MVIVDMVIVTVYRVLAYSTLILAWVSQSYQKRNYYFAIERCEVRSTDPLLCDVNCTLVQSGHHKTITGYLNNFRATEKFGAAAEIIARSVNGGDYMTILNQTFPDLCPFLGSKKLLGLAEIAFDALKKNGKLPKCPVEKGVYYLKEYYLSPELFPPYVPEAEFEIKGTFFGNENGIILPCVDWFLKGRVALTRNQFWQNKKAQPAGLI